eukprot:14894392-Heterocapsa_arctica.AAC.1
MAKLFVMRNKRKTIQVPMMELRSTNKHGQERKTTKLKSMKQRGGNTLGHIIRQLIFIFPKMTSTFRANSLIIRQIIVSSMAKRSGIKPC